MSIFIIVPEMGESVIDATVARWIKNLGDRVDSGDPVVELETDKVNLEVSAPAAGILIEIKALAGNDVKVGDVLGAIDPVETQNLGSDPESSHESVALIEDHEDKRQRVTPLARKVAEDKGVSLLGIEGSGPGGKIVRVDIEMQSRDVQTAASTPELHPTSTSEDTLPQIKPIQSPRGEERIRLTRRRQTIARRLVEAQHAAAMLTTFNEVDMSAVMDLRRRRREDFKKKHGVDLGFMSFFVKSVVLALKENPILNAEIQGEEIVLKHYYDIGVAVGAEEGLVVPVLRDAASLSFAEIERGIKSFAIKAQDGTLTLGDLRGGTFTITNGGVFGSLMSTPILNPPQVGILGMHRIQERPVAVNKEVVVRPMMYIALSYDHRIVDGRDAVLFLVRVKDLIEDPTGMLIEG